MKPPTPSADSKSLPECRKADLTRSARQIPRNCWTQKLVDQTLFGPLTCLVTAEHERVESNRNQSDAASCENFCG